MPRHNSGRLVAPQDPRGSHSSRYQHYWLLLKQGEGGQGFAARAHSLPVTLCLLGAQRLTTPFPSLMLLARYSLDGSMTGSTLAVNKEVNQLGIRPEN